ncbi:hypothetical protein BSLG_003434 [Batrachochytrium salamandrivorans]|nr:hypothetical protein BSLG_003434 [Batrachochytrium salamandrivorans]
MNLQTPITLLDIDWRASLEENGTAVDAAVASSLCISVTNMYRSSGINDGGGFMIVRSTNGKSEFINFREKAPAAAATNIEVIRPFHGSSSDPETGGILTMADMAAYPSTVGSPMIGSFRGKRVITSPTTYIWPGIFPDRTFEPGHYAAACDVLNDHGTMHLSILTEQGEAVSLRQRSTFYSGQSHFVLSLELSSMMRWTISLSQVFQTHIRTGLITYNYIRPGKWPMSSSVPTIIESADGSHVEIVAGASGGSMIITSRRYPDYSWND